MHEFLWFNRLYHGWLWYLILRELIYAERAVPHIFSGQATARETQAHLISTGVLSALLTGKVHNIDFDLHVEEENFASKFHEALNGKEEL